MGLLEEVADNIVNQLENISERLERLESRSEYNTDITMLEAKEVAERIGVSHDKVYSMARKKEIPHVKLGRKVLFPRRRLVEWIESNIVEVQQDEKIAI